MSKCRAHENLSNFINDDIFIANLLYRFFDGFRCWHFPKAVAENKLVVHCLNLYP